jgi:hypothetical protein
MTDRLDTRLQEQERDRIGARYGKQIGTVSGSG